MDGEDRDKKEEVLLDVEFVPQKKPKQTKVDIEKTLNKLLLFFDGDIDSVVEYIMLGEVPPHFITPGKRIDLHPTREYLLRLPRVIGDIKRLIDSLNDDGDELENFW